MDTHYIFPDDYMADPSAHVFGQRLFIYPSHDWDSGVAEDDSGGHFEMRDYHVLTLDDAYSGEARDLGVAFSLEDVPWASRQLWDNDVVEKDGKYYLIFCGKDKTDIFRLGVAIASDPAGPFVPQPDPIRGSYSIDPCVFRDDDGAIYVYFGGIWGGQLQRYRDNKLLDMEHLPKGTEPALCPRVARLTDDVLQFAEDPSDVIIYDESGERMIAEDPHHFFEASWMHKHNGRYYFSWSTGDTHLLCYAVGACARGPFTYRGVLLGRVVGWTSHHSICEFQGRTLLFHHDSGPSGGRTWLRSLKVKELFYDENGDLRG